MKPGSRSSRATRATREIEQYLEYVLDSFFGGSYSEFKQHSSRHLSFRELAEREDLQVSYSWLSQHPDDPALPRDHV